MTILARILLAILLWPLAMSVWVSFTPSRYLQGPVREWSLQWYREFFSGPVWMDALLNSLGTAALSASLSILIALPAGLLMARSRFRGKAFVEGALLLPLVLPGVALAVGMLAVVRSTPLWGSQFSLAVGHSVLSMPVAFLVLRATIQQVDPALEAVARGLGAGPLQVFRFVTLPLIAPGVLASALFATVMSLNEVTISLFLATRYTETLPRVIWPNLRFAITPLVAAASTVLLAISLPALIGAGWWLRPRRANR